MATTLTSSGITFSDATSQTTAVTSAILAAKAPLASPTFTGTVTTAELDNNGGIREQQVTKSASFTPSFSEGTIYSCSGSMTITMPTATSGRSFTIIHSSGSSITWSGTILWNGGSAPTAAAAKEIYVFLSDGTNWYGNQAGTGYA